MELMRIVPVNLAELRILLDMKKTFAMMIKPSSPFNTDGWAWLRLPEKMFHLVSLRVGVLKLFYENVPRILTNLKVVGLDRIIP